MKGDNVIDMDRFNSDALGKLNSNSALPLIILVAVFLILIKSVIVVGAGKRVVVFNSFTGVEQRALGEGMHFLVPFVQSPIIYDVKTQSYTMASKRGEGNYRGDDSIEALTADGQKVKVDLSVIYNLQADKVWNLHKEIGQNYVNKILRPQIRSIARSTVSSYPVMDLYSEKRLEVQNEIQSKVKSQMAKYFINVPEVLIRTVTFSDEFARAVEQKQVALQEAERMKYVLQKEEREKQRKIIEADGEATAIKMKANALRANPQLIQYEYVRKISPGIKTIITDQNAIMNFPESMFEKK